MQYLYSYKPRQEKNAVLTKSNESLNSLFADCHSYLSNSDTPQIDQKHLFNDPNPET